MRGQTRLESFKEVLFGRIVYYVFSLLSQVFLFEVVLDLNYDLVTHCLIVGYFFTLSTIFNYFWRRLWNKRHMQQLKKD